MDPVWLEHVAKNIDTGYQKSWSIGNVNGIKQAKTFRMYIFFQKYIYNGSEWEATGVKEALPTEFKSKAIDFTVTPSGTITPTATAGSVPAVMIITEQVAAMEMEQMAMMQRTMTEQTAIPVLHLQQTREQPITPRLPL